MKNYLDICSEIINEGYWKSDSRPGVRTLGITGATFKHNMADGFPILTTRKLYIKQSLVETEGFLQGITDKSWYQERGCKFWDKHCNPEKVPYNTDAESLSRMEAENDLGPIYGAQWRAYANHRFESMHYSPDLLVHSYIDQLRNVVEQLEINPLDRRMVVLAWNPAELYKMALPPCHLLWQVVSDGTNLDLLWYQRSVDVPIGLPNNITSYATILILLAQTSGLTPRFLVGQLGDTHIYENQLDEVKKQLQHEPLPLPSVKIQSKNILDWDHTDFELSNYTHHVPIKYAYNV